MTFPARSRDKLRVGRKKKIRRYRPGTVALCEIRKYQKDSDFLLPLVPFAKLVREIASSEFGDTFRFQSSALLALQEAAEFYLALYFEKAQAAADHAKRMTVMPKDLSLVQNLASNFTPVVKHSPTGIAATNFEDVKELAAKLQEHGLMPHSSNFKGWKYYHEFKRKYEKSTFHWDSI